MATGHLLTITDRHIVLDADADALPAIVDGRLSFRDRQTIADVQARLHREHHAGLQLNVMLPEAVSAHIVHIQTQPVTGAVHVEMAISPLFDQAIHIPEEQA